MSGTVVVPEVKPVRVAKGVAFRLLLGRFISRYIDAFVGIAGVQAFLGTLAGTPLTFDTWRAIVYQLAGPAVFALVNVLRAAWPAIRAYFNNGFSTTPPEGDAP